MFKTYGEFDNILGTTVYGVLVGGWTLIGSGGGGRVYRVVGAAGESAIVKLSHSSSLTVREVVRVEVLRVTGANETFSGTVCDGPCGKHYLHSPMSENRRVLLSCGMVITVM